MDAADGTLVIMRVIYHTLCNGTPTAASFELDPKKSTSVESCRWKMETRMSFSEIPASTPQLTLDLSDGQ
jgi:hypothetical protein